MKSFLNVEVKEMEMNIKTISDCLKQKKRSKKLLFSKLIVKCKDNIKKTWSVIKEVIEKEKIPQQKFPKKICIGNKEITDLKTIAEKFNKFFTEIGLNLAKDIDPYRSLLTTI